MQFSDKDLHNAHKHAWGNEEELTKSDKAGCFNCLHVFDFFGIDLIKEWVVNPFFEEFKQISETLTSCLDKPLELPSPKRRAVCPKCEGETLIGSASGYPVSNPNFLKAMHNRWVRIGSSKEEREERFKLIQEAKMAKQTFIILPSQSADKFPKDLNIDPKPETLLCFQCNRETFNQEDVARRYCGHCDMVMTNVLSSSAIKESYDKLNPMGATITINSPACSEIAGEVEVEKIKAMIDELVATPPPENTIIIDTPTTGFPVFDKNVVGFKKGEIVSVIGRVGCGRPVTKFYDYTDLEAKPSTEACTLTGKAAEEANLYWKHVHERRCNETKERERQKKADRLARLIDAGLSEKHAAIFETSFEDVDTVVKVINMMFEHGYGCETIG